MVDVDERKPRKLVTNITNIARPHWWAMESGYISFPGNLAGRDFIVVPPPAEMPFYSPKVPL